jgi:hypothetical protein
MFTIYNMLSVSGLRLVQNIDQTLPPSSIPTTSCGQRLVWNIFFCSCLPMILKTAGVRKKVMARRIDLPGCFQNRPLDGVAK